MQTDSSAGEEEEAMAQPMEVLAVAEDRLARVSVIIDWLIVHHSHRDELSRSQECVLEAHRIIKGLIPTA